MANRVIRTNLFSESRNNVEAIISANVSDPVTTSTQYRKWIYSRFPDVKNITFKGYPFIIIHPSEVDISEEKASLDMKSKEVSWNIEVEIITSDRGYANNDGKGLSYMDSISDSIMSVFLDKPNRIILRGNSMNFAFPTTTAVITDVVADELIYRRSILISFKSKMQVSS